MALTAADYLARVDAAMLLRGLGGPVRPAPADAAACEALEGVVRARLGAARGPAAGALAQGLLGAGAMNPAPALLDLGPDTGPLAGDVDQALRERGLRPRWFRMASSPAALLGLEEHAPRGVGFLGLASDLEGSVRAARALQPLPELLDGALGAFVREAPPEGLARGLARVLGFGAPFAVLADREQGPALAARAAEPARVAAWQEVAGHAAWGVAAGER